MVDFRSSAERDADESTARNNRNQEQADYKRMYETVLAENRALDSKFNALEAKFGDVVGHFETVQSQFAALQNQMKERSDELFQMSETMQEMVESGYKQQTDLMERFRGDISQRLTKAQEKMPLVGNGDG